MDVRPTFSENPDSALEVKMSQKMTQSTSLSEDTLSDEGLVDRWGNPSSPGAFAESPIPEEASFLSSEGFQGDRIQGESFSRVRLSLWTIISDKKCSAHDTAEMASPAIEDWWHEVLRSIEIVEFLSEDSSCFACFCFCNFLIESFCLQWR